MAGDINLSEQIIILPSDQSPKSRSLSNSFLPSGRIMHEYGPRVKIVEIPKGREESFRSAMSRALAPPAQALSIPEDLDEVGRYGLQAMQMRSSSSYAQAKAAREYDSRSWHDGGTEALRCTDEAFDPSSLRSRALADGSPTSARLTGTVAVGLIIVEGPGAELRFTEEERTKVVAEVQNGLGWLGSQNPQAAVVWKYDIHVIKINKKPGSELSFSQKEALWRDEAMKKIGYGSGMTGVYQYVEDIRRKLQTDWTYCAFFTKYPVGHFAYAAMNGPRLVMHYQNDGWGPDNIDRVFAHETGHIFGAPDEYKGSRCSCGGQWGYHKQPNANCEACNPQSVNCIMKANTWDMCAHTPYHLGFPVKSQTYSGVWRAGQGKHGLWVDSTWSSFYKKWEEWGDNNLRLIDMKITQSDEGRRYHGVWREGKGGYALWVNAEWADFKRIWKDWGDKGLRLIDLEVIQSNGKNLYSGVWEEGKEAYGLWINSDWSSFKAKWKEWGKKGLRLIDLKVINLDDKLRYFGVWRAGTGRYALWINADWDSFNSKWREWAGKGYRLIDLEIVIVNGKRRYFGVWGAGKDSYGLWVNANWQSFEAKWKEWADKGYRLIDIDIQNSKDVSGSPLPPEALSLGASEDEDGFSGVGFLSDENVEETSESDLGVGKTVFLNEREAVAPARENQLVFGPEESLSAASPEGEEGIGGLAEGLSAEVDDVGLGGLGVESEEGEEEGFGGIREE